QVQKRDPSRQHPRPPDADRAERRWLDGVRGRAREEIGGRQPEALLDAERTLLEAQDRLARSKTDTATALVALYKALGGGWEAVDKVGQTEPSSSSTE
ncbi:MAG: hypothetical protein L0191_01425, partial [Acidobacteria bacterium]|nr:hypothetical protein [Acidobacteriota bacterium]